VLLTRKVRIAEERALLRERSYAVVEDKVEEEEEDKEKAETSKDGATVRVVCSVFFRVSPVLLGRGRLLTAVVLFFVVASFKDLTWRGGVLSKPRIKRSTRSAAERLASSVRVVLSCFSPYGWSGEFEGSVRSFDCSCSNDFWSIGVST
jgi:hypothetical protein